MAKDRQIKLSVTESMFNELTDRAERMSISVPALCCYFIGEKLDRLKQQEQVTMQKIDSISIQDLLSSLQHLSPEQESMFKTGIKQGIQLAEMSEIIGFDKLKDKKEE